MSGEKRSSERKKIGVTLTFTLGAAGKPSHASYSTITTDISDAGMSFELNDQLPLGTEIEALVQAPGRVKPIACILVVVRVESDLSMKCFRTGATYKSIDAKDRAFLASAISKINLRALLDEMIRVGASDMHLIVGLPPVLRKNGELCPLEQLAVEDGQVKAMFFPLINESRRRFFEKKLELDFAFSLSANERFRINLHWQREHMEAAVRNVSAMFKNFEELRLPSASLEAFCRARSGLVLIAGRAGSGKSTTLSSMIEFINTNYSKVIISIEDPIEFLFANKKGIVKQREVGRDTLSYAAALKASLRQNPDVIVVSELLDHESLLTAISAAETGHLVLATVHAGNTVQAIEKVIGSFPADSVGGISKRLASCLKGVLFQVLLPGLSGKTVLATELLLNTPAVSNLIALGDFNQLAGVIETGHSKGMHSLASSMRDLVAEGIIARGVNPKEF